MDLPQLAGSGQWWYILIGGGISRVGSDSLFDR